MLTFLLCRDCTRLTLLRFLAGLVVVQPPIFHLRSFILQLIDSLEYRRGFHLFELPFSNLSEAQKPSWHCHPESFRIVWIFSRWSKKFPDSLESFLIVRIFSGWSGMFSDSLESFRIVRIFSRWSGKFPHSLEVSSKSI